MTNTLKTRILAFIDNSIARVTQKDLENELSQKYSIKKKAINLAIRQLVEENELIYTNIYGCTFLEKSFNRPVRISEKIVLKPPQVFYQGEPGDILINISQGDSFGTGQHPTTRLALMGIEYAIREGGLLRNEKDTCALDIGTGSGVLAIAAVKMGISKAIGTDIDPCAIAEAKDNVRLNGLTERIEIYNQDINDSHSNTSEWKQENRFSLILANLRCPTLKSLYPTITKITEQGGYIIFTGIKTDEAPYLLHLYTEKHFCCKWEKSEKDWVGGLLKKKY